MGRRTIIPMSTIKRLAALSNKNQRQNYNAQLLSSQENEKQTPPTYTLIDFNFNLNTRNTRIEFLQKQSYRTIERYITQNYVKYPVYSEWKIKEKKIPKNIKLTNSVLESLNKHEDELIRLFSEKIVLLLNNEELFPSWFIKLYLQKELDETLDFRYTQFKALKENQNQLVNLEKRKIYLANIAINKQEQILNKLTTKRDRLSLSLANIHQAKPNIFKAIFSLGIYSYLISNKRVIKLTSKVLALNENIGIVNNLITSLQNDIAKSNQIIEVANKKLTEELAAYNQYKENCLKEYSLKLSKVQPLSTEIKTDDKFIMLKYFSGLEYKSIIGVYIIHNIEKDKYYVGQSKDVMKRIKQHFNGTIPKNSIFAEDYYTSKIEDKENLFEVKIIPCQTKDELDLLEKTLIAEYDSWNNGYNGTSGNK